MWQENKRWQKGSVGEKETVRERTEKTKESCCRNPLDVWYGCVVIFHIVKPHRHNISLGLHMSALLCWSIFAHPPVILSVYCVWKVRCTVSNLGMWPKYSLICGHWSITSSNIVIFCHSTLKILNIDKALLACHWFTCFRSPKLFVSQGPKHKKMHSNLL